MPDNNLDPEIQESLKEESLRYVSDSIPGFFRQKLRKSFIYYDTDGSKITSPIILGRIEKLVIPPAWKNVWICPKSNGHLQATGFDEKGRKQYIYHADWVKITQENKFSKMIDFGLCLPKIRSKISYDMNRSGYDKRKIVSTMIWLLEHTFIRVGNEEYKKENDSYGLTTLRNRHAHVKGSQIQLRFRGKHGVENIIEISHPKVAKIIKKCIELPGYELFQYIDENGNRYTIDSSDINEFLKEVTNDDFSAKDFRTWGATNLSSRLLYDLGEAESMKILKSNVNTTIKKVAKHLNNTVSVCKNYYIHPTVIKSYSENKLIPHFNHYKDLSSQQFGLKWHENALVNLLKKYHN